MDRLFEQLSRWEHRRLGELAALEAKLQRQRRLRRWLVAGAAAASVLVWAGSRSTPRARTGAALLFALWALSAVAVYGWERRLRGQRRRARARLATETRRALGRRLQSAEPQATRIERALHDEYDLDGERVHLTSMRRVLTSCAAILGVSPCLHALAPRLVPSLVLGLCALWSALICTLVAIWLQETLLWRRQRLLLSSPARVGPLSSPAVVDLEP